MSTEQCYKYFKQQNATSPNNMLDPETNMETHSIERAEGPLDYPITDEEFEAAVNKVKANKSPGIDNILNEVIKIGNDAIKGHLVNLFNLANTLLFGVLASLCLFTKRMIDPKSKITEVSLCFLR